MVRLIMLAVVCLAFAGSSAARGQDTDEVKQLNKEIELLQAKLEAANLKVEKLEAEVRKFKGSGKVEPDDKRSLSDLLPVGVVAAGQYAFPGANGEVGEADLTITERDGSKVKGRYGAKRPGEAERVPGFEFEGTISGNTLTAKSVGSAQKKTLKVSLRGNELTGTVGNIDRRMTATVSFKLDK